MKVFGEYMNLLIDFFKGILIGLFMLVPGISGGSIAIIFGIYERLLTSLNNLFKTFKSNVIFLFVVGLGGVLGIILSSFVLAFFIENYYYEMLYIFIGIMLHHTGNIMSKIKKTNLIKSLIFILVGLFLGYLMTKIPIGLLCIKNNILSLLILGIFLAVALILPGISVSYVLLIFGIYNDVITAIKILDFIYLFKLFFFLMIGCFLVIKIICYLLSKHENVISNITIGFIFSSLWIVMPKVESLRQVIYSLIFIFIGIFIKKVASKRN